MATVFFVRQDCAQRKIEKGEGGGLFVRGSFIED